MGGYYVKRKELFCPEYNPIILRIRWFIALISGYSTEDFFCYHLYEKKRRERKEFVSLRKSYKIIKYLNNEGSIERDTVEDKEKFAKVFKDYTLRKIFCASNGTYESFTDFCKDLERIIVKPADGCNGEGVFIEEDITQKSLDTLWMRIKGKKFVVEEVLEQDGILRELNPKTLNTIRVNILYDHGKAQIVNAILRSGQGDVVTDNICSGGCVCEIETSTGIVKTEFVDLSNHIYKKHPLTGVTMKGKGIPSWNKVCETAMNVSKFLPNVGYQSWDIAVVKGGDVAVVEGNTYGNFNIQQVPQMQGVRKKYETFCRQYKKK